MYFTVRMWRRRVRSTVGKATWLWFLKCTGTRQQLLLRLGCVCIIITQFRYFCRYSKILRSTFLSAITGKFWMKILPSTPKRAMINDIELTGSLRVVSRVEWSRVSRVTMYIIKSIVCFRFIACTICLTVYNTVSDKYHFK